MKLDKGDLLCSSILFATSASGNMYLKDVGNGNTEVGILSDVAYLALGWNVLRPLLWTSRLALSVLPLAQMAIAPPNA